MSAEQAATLLQKLLKRRRLGSAVLVRAEGIKARIDHADGRVLREARVGEHGWILRFIDFVLPAFELLFEKRELGRDRRNVERTERIEQDARGARRPATGAGHACGRA